MPGRLLIEKESVFVAFGFILIAGVFFVFGGWQLWTTGRFLLNAETVEARVVAPNESCDDDGCTWWPDMAYDLPDGRERIVPVQFGSSEYRFAEGEAVTVHVNPAYDYVRVAGAGNLWLLGGAFFALGSLGVGIGLWVLFRLGIRWNRD